MNPKNIPRVIEHLEFSHSLHKVSPKSIFSAAKETIEFLMNAIRKHRDQRGDDRCWLNDEELYKVLPEGYTPPVRDTKVELEMCRKFIECRHNPATQYVSPQTRIEELEQVIRTIADEATNVI